MQKFLDVAVENVFGNLWTRPGLDDKTRALICVVSDTCTGREPELELHLRMALRQGWTEDELIEVMLHLSGYIGVPIIRESMMVASRVFKEYRGEAGRTLSLSSAGGASGGIAALRVQPGTLAPSDGWLGCNRVFRSRRRRAAPCWHMTETQMRFGQGSGSGSARPRASGWRRSPAWLRCR